MNKKLIGVKKMNRAMRTAFLKATKYDLKMSLDSDFYYNTDTHKIYYSIIVSEKADRNFSAFLTKEFNIIDIDEFDLFCISVLHEIGHYVTWDNIDDDIKDFCEDEEEHISYLTEKYPNNDEIYSRYFSLETEYVATEWAAKWIKKHPKKYQKLYNDVKQAIFDFYSVNA